MRPTADNCVHHWKIEPAIGPTSKARCMRCSTRRVFSNHLPSTDFCGRDKDEAQGGNYSRMLREQAVI